MLCDSLGVSSSTVYWSFWRTQWCRLEANMALIGGGRKEAQYCIVLLLFFKVAAITIII
jgi:hypothetical protein